MPVRLAFKLFKHGSLWIYRGLTYALVAFAIAFALVVLLVRYWLLPNIDQYREEIVYGLSRASHQHVQIGLIEGDWDGFRPRLVLHDFALLDADGKERVSLEKVDSTLAWWSLFVGRLRFYSIELEELNLKIHRDAAGVLHVADIALADTPDSDDGGLGDWLLQQHRIVLRNSQLTWSDDRLGGAPLVLKDVEFRVERSFGTHAFGLRARPPAEVASPLDVRGEMIGRSFGDLKSWSGLIYSGIARTDLAALRQWVQLPMQTTRGTGSVKIWSSWSGGKPIDVTAEVALEQVLTRLDKDLPTLELTRLQGRLGWRDNGNGQVAWARKLSFATPDGVRLPPADITYSRSLERAGQPISSEVAFDALELDAVVRLIDRVPVDPALRARLAELDPRGALRDFHVNWQDQFSLSGRYSIRGGFAKVSWHASGYLPGIANVTGSLNASEKGGTLSGKASATAMAMPTVFKEPLTINTLDARVSWLMTKGVPAINVERLTIDNPHMVGQVTGRYQAVATGPGVVDIKGTFARADGAQVWRYVPLVLSPMIRDWLQKSLLSANARDIQVILKGDLHNFPFTNPATGRFEVTAAVDNGSLIFAPGWPQVDGITGNIAFRGKRMDITGNQGHVMGATLSGVSVVIADLGAQKPVVEARGEAEGPSSDFLRYVNDSPVRARVGAFTEGMRAAGRGRLNLKLELPLRDLDTVKLAGLYTFAGNTFYPAEGIPAVEQFSGKLAFTQESVALHDGQARLYGGPAHMTVTTDTGGSMRIQANGQADIGVLRNDLHQPVLAHVSGITDWRMNAEVQAHRFDFVLDSSLQGVTSTLPVPFAKSAQDRVALHIERRERSAAQDLVTATYGSLMSAQLLLDKSGRQTRIARGEIALGDTAPVPQRDGVWISGSLERADIEQWQDLIDEQPRDGASDAILAGITVSVKRARALSRDFDDVRVQATRQDNDWQVKLGAKQFSGDARWLPQGQGAIIARFGRLELPMPTAEIKAVDAKRGEGKNLPSLDITADDFRMGTRQFGRLALIAVPNARDWRIDRLELVNSDGTLTGTGLWQPWSTHPRTQMDLKLEVSDIGRFFTRLDLPKGIDRGKANLDGKVSWAGPPYSLDLPTLSGHLQLTAEKGRFVKIDPGIGKLLSVVSLQTLPKVAMLDFRDIFSEGFAFDKIGGNVDIAQGLARTQDFELVGPAARVEMKGEVSLAAETQQLDVRIFPSLSNSIALGTALVNPIIGLGALVVQKALKDPFSHLLSFQYHIAGSWTAPTVTKKTRAQVSDGPAGRK
ncbi:MAG: YhdP family protein [Betaproteobacteria bacterium]